MKSPFKFLDSFTKDDREIFFGRDREIEELYHRVFESKIMLVYGVSGTGKSSLIHCGLANKFQETDWLPLVIRRGENMVSSISESIKAASITPQEGQFVTANDFRKAVRSLYLDYYKPVFLIFDQFEELFIFGSKEERQSFIQIVKSITDSDIQCRFIFVMREEYMAGFSEFEKHIPNIFSNRVRIEKMSPVNAIEAIKGPCKAAGISLEEGFSEALLERLSPQSADVELTYLQVFLDNIFRLAAGFLPPHGGDSKGGSSITGAESKGGLSFSLNLLSQAGNVSDLLGSFLDDQISRLDDPDLAMTVLKAFVSGKGTKRPANETETVNNVRSLGKDISHGMVKELLQNFVKLRVLRDKDDSGRYELRHDALAEKIFEKFSLAEKELLEKRQLIENAYQYYLKRGVLLNNDDLIYISGKDSFLNLNPELSGFLLESRKHQSARKKTFRRLIAISVLALLMLLSTIGFGIIKNTKWTNSIRFASESISQYRLPIDRLSMAAMAWEKNNGIQSHEALLEAFNLALKYTGKDSIFTNIKAKYLKDFAPASTPIEFAGCSKNDKLIYGFTVDSVIIWNEKGNINSRFSVGNKSIINLVLSDNCEYLGGVSIDSILTVWDISGNVQFKKKIRFNPLNKSQIFRFTKENRVLYLSSEHDAELGDLKGNIIQSFDFHKGSVNALDLSDDGLFIATASSDSTVNIWYRNPDKKRYEQYETLTMHNDTVWSVNFAPNSRYVITASADQSVKVTSINNDYVYGRKRKYEILVGFPVLAEFDNSGTGIVFQSFETRVKTGKPYMIANYFDLNESTVNSAEISKFDYLEFSPDKKYLVYVSGDETYLISRLQYLINTRTNLLINNYRLLQLRGQKPFFSYDGKNVYTINGRKIENWFIDISTISLIASEYFQNWNKFLQ